MLRPVHAKTGSVAQSKTRTPTTYEDTDSKKSRIIVTNESVSKANPSSEAPESASKKLVIPDKEAPQADRILVIPGKEAPQADNGADGVVEVAGAEEEKFDNKTPRVVYNYITWLILQNDNTQAFALFLACQITGALFYLVYAIRDPLNSDNMGLIVGTITTVVCVIVQLYRAPRIILLVTMPTLVTSKLRVIILLIILSLSIRGPMLNTISNIRLSVETSVCVREQVKGLSEAMQERIKNKLGDLPVEDAEELLKQMSVPLNTMRDYSMHIEKVFRQMLQYQSYVRYMLRDVIRMCHSLAMRPYDLCRFLARKYCINCNDKFVSFICDRLHDLPAICDFPSTVRAEVMQGASYVVKTVASQIAEKAKNTSLYALLTKKPPLVQFEKRMKLENKVAMQVDEFKAKLRADVEIFVWMTQNIADLMDNITLFLILYPFIMGVVYIVKFNRADDRDNIHIGKALFEVNRIHCKSGGPNIFPLRPKEKKLYLDPFSTHLSTRERGNLALRLAMVVISLVIPFLFVFMDIITFTLVDQTFEFLHSNYTILEKPSLYRLKVKGNGMLQGILTNVFRSFQPYSEATEMKDQMWRVCFVSPNRPDYDSTRAMIVLVAIAVLSVFAEIYARRSRHLLAGFYFPDRRTERAEFLYRKIVTGRRTILWYALQKRTKLRRAAQDEKTGEKGAFDMKAYTGGANECYRCFRADVSLTNAGNTRVCVKCKAIYCLDCFTVRRKCLKCNWKLQRIAKNTEFYNDSSASDESGYDDAPLPSFLK